MPTVTRDENGRWLLTSDAEDHLPFISWLQRHLNALDPIFARARASSEVQFILSLLRVRGIQDAGWDPFENTLRAIPRIRDLCEGTDTETGKHVALWLYGHIFEASEPYEILANLIRVASGGEYRMGSAFPPRGNRQASPGEKIRALEAMAIQAGFPPDTFTPVLEVWDRRLRNAIFHSDYTITRDGLRIMEPRDRYSWDRFDNLINGALAYFNSVSHLYEMHISSYEEPTEIPNDPRFTPDPESRPIVMVRQGHGAIGLKDGWTAEQIREGKIPFRIGRFTAEEIRMVNTEPTRALFPPE